MGAMCTSRSQPVAGYVVELAPPLRQIKKLRLEEAIGRSFGPATADAEYDLATLATTAANGLTRWTWATGLDGRIEDLRASALPGRFPSSLL